MDIIVVKVYTKANIKYVSIKGTIYMDYTEGYYTSMTYRSNEGRINELELLMENTKAYITTKVKYTTALRTMVGKYKYKKITKITEVTQDGLYILEG